MDDPRKALEAYILAPVQWTSLDLGYSALWTFFYYLASYQPMFKAINDSIRQVGRERISLLLYKYQEGRMRFRRTSRERPP